jgi:hypothetical protein
MLHEAQTTKRWQEDLCLLTKAEVKSFIHFHFMLCALFVIYVSEFSEGARRFCHYPAVAFSQKTAGEQAITNLIGWIWIKKSLLS